MTDTELNKEGISKTILTLAIDAADVEKLMAAFHAGKLADLGVTDVNILSQNGTHASKVDTNRRSSSNSQRTCD